MPSLPLSRKDFDMKINVSLSCILKKRYVMVLAGILLAWVIFGGIFFALSADTKSKGTTSPPVAFIVNGAAIRPGRDGTVRLKSTAGCITVRVNTAAAQTGAKLSDELYFENHLLYANTCGQVEKTSKENYRELTLQPPVKLDKNGKVSYDKWKKGTYQVKIYAVDGEKKNPITGGGFEVQ